jgi:flagellar motor switch protein FliG
MESSKLAGSIKVAILIQSLGASSKEAVLGMMSGGERDKVNAHLSEMGKISPDLVEKVAAEFIDGISRKKSLKIAGPSNTAADAGNNSAPSSMDILLKLEPEHLVQLIKDEHPQTIAVILIHLKPDVASNVLSRLPDEKKADVSMRIANSEKIVAGMIEEIESVFEDILKNEQGSVTHNIGGAGRLAEILNQAESSSAQMILDEIEEDNPEMAAEIKQMMFVFEDLVMVDDKGMQAMLRKVETKELAVALKGATDEVKDKAFKNMSERATEMLKEEIDSAGSVRMKDVEIAQQAITKLIQDMEEKGEVVIGGRGGEQFIA